MRLVCDAVLFFDLKIYPTSGTSPAMGTFLMSSLSESPLNPPKANASFSFTFAVYSYRWEFTTGTSTVLIWRKPFSAPTSMRSTSRMLAGVCSSPGK